MQGLFFFTFQYSIMQGVLFDIGTGYVKFSFFSLNTQRIQVKHSQVGYRACQGTALFQDALIKTNTFGVLRVT